MTDNWMLWSCYNTNDRRRVFVEEILNNIPNVTVSVPANVTVNQTEQIVYVLLSVHPEYTRNQLAQETSKTVRKIQRTLDSLK